MNKRCKYYVLVAVLGLLALTVFGADGAAAVPAAAEGGGIDIQATLLSVLGPKWGPLAVKLVLWMGTLRLLLKPVNAKVQSWLERLLSRVVSTEDKADDALAVRVMASTPYKILAYVFDQFSIKLPEKLPTATEPKP